MAMLVFTRFEVRRCRIYVGANIKLDYPLGYAVKLIFLAKITATSRRRAETQWAARQGD